MSEVRAMSTPRNFNLKSSFLTLGAILTLSAMSGCASMGRFGHTDEASPVFKPEPFQALLDQRAQEVSSAWKELVSLEKNIDKKDQKLGQEILNSYVEPIVFTGTIESFVLFLAYTINWQPMDPEGNRMGGAQAPTVTVKFQGGPLIEVLKDAGSQVTHTADLVVSPLNRTIKVVYRN